MSRQYKPKAGFWIRLVVAIVYPLDGLMFKLRWRHLERMPAKGGVIVVINHISHIDTVLMARLVWQSGRIPRFLIKNTLFDMPLLGRMFRGCKQIPVYRGTTDAAKSLREATESLARGEAIVIYPEGTITKDPDHWPMQAKTGMARLVMLTPDTPIVPIGQWGAQSVEHEKRFRLPRRRLAEASLGEPIDLSMFRDAPATVATLRAITDTIMTAVRDQVAELRGEAPPTEFFRPLKPSKKTESVTPTEKTKSAEA